MRSSRLGLLLLLPTLALASSCTMSEEDVLARIFPTPTEKTITNVPATPLAQLIDQEIALRRFRNPEELVAALGETEKTTTAPLVTEALPLSILHKTYVYRGSDLGISYGKLGDSQLPVRVLSLTFKPEGLAVVDDTLIVTGKSANAGKTAVAYISMVTPATPRLVHSVEVDGTLLGVRSAPHTAFLVLRGSWSDGFQVPGIYVNGQAPEYDYKRPTCSCPALYGFQRGYTNPGYLHILSVSISNPANLVTQQVIALSEDQKVQLGAKALYIGYQPRLTDDDVMLEVLSTALTPRLDARAKVQYTEIVRAPDYLLSAEEKRAKQLQFLERQKDMMASDAKEIFHQDLQRQLDLQLRDFQRKTDVTMLHKLRFDEAKLQYVSASVTPGKPFPELLAGEWEQGTWLLSRSTSTGTGALLRTLNEQMEPGESVALAKVLQPLVRRAKGTDLWVGTSGSQEVYEVDLIKPEVRGTRTLVADARMMTIDDTRGVQLSKVQNGMSLTLLETTGDTKVLATLDLTGTGAYSRLFDNLAAAYYLPSQKMLVLHVEESRRPGATGSFDGVMLFAVGDTTLEKKAEFDLRAGMGQLVGDSDIQILPVSETEVAVLYGKTASLINVPELKESVRKVLQ